MLLVFLMFIIIQNTQIIIWYYNIKLHIKLISNELILNIYLCNEACKILNLRIQQKIMTFLGNYLVSQLFCWICCDSYIFYLWRTEMPSLFFKSRSVFTAFCLYLFAEHILFTFVKKTLKDVLHLLL